MSSQHDQGPVILSALAPDQRWDSGLANADAYRGLQSMFGWDAQLKAFAAVLKQLDIQAWVTPAPEMFFSPVATDLLAAKLGVGADAMARAIHVRFGGARFGRVFRGVPNFIANAEGAWGEILTPGKHPFRSHNVAPHAMAVSLDLVANASALFRPNGEEIVRHRMPKFLVSADFPQAVKINGPLDPVDFRGFEIHSITEFNADSWSGAKLAPPSLGIRRIAMEYNSERGDARPFILVPWNLANPASCATDLAETYLRSALEKSRAAFVVLLPYNASGAISTLLNHHLDAISHRLASFAPAAAFAQANSMSLNLFIARVTDLGCLAVLRRIQAVAWIDGTDPEAEWCCERIAAAGLRPLVLRPAGADAADGSLTLLDGTGMVESQSEFGQLFYRRWTLSARGMERLVAATAGLPAASLPPMVRKASSAQEAQFRAALRARRVELAPV